ncbi:hypothetical protein D3C76_1243570 [compost metagenome]
MGHRLGKAFGIERNLADRQGLANLHQSAFAHDALTGFRLPEEIDGQAGGDGQGDDADLAEQGDVDRHVGYRHQRRPRDRSTGAQVRLVHFLGYRRAAVADRLDNDPGLGKFCLEESSDLFFVGHTELPFS